MPIRFVCLANSFKEGGRCIAGIELAQNNNLILEEGRAKWIRPICKTPYGEIPTNLVTNINLLDILEVEATGYPQQKSYQSENFFFNQNSIRPDGRFDTCHLDQHCNTRNVIFGNRGKAVSEDGVKFLDHSLMLVKANRFSVTEKIYDDNADKPKMRLKFWYFGTQYDFPITDPVFLQNYRKDPHIIEGVEMLYLSLSLGIAHENWHYKLVAGITF